MNNPQSNNQIKEDKLCKRKVKKRKLLMAVSGVEIQITDVIKKSVIQ